MFYKCRYQRFLFLPKPFSLCIKKQNPALTVVLTSVIPKLGYIINTYRGKHHAPVALAKKVS